MTEIAERYRRHADAFEAKVAAVPPDRWEDPSPCEKWTARDVVQHIVDMHGAMLSPNGRKLSSAPPVGDDPLAAFRGARADVEALLADGTLAAAEVGTPTGPMSNAEHIDRVVSDDMVLHGWDLAKATGQDDTIDPGDLERIGTAMASIPAGVMEKMRTPGAFGEGVEVFGPEVPLPPDASAQDRLLSSIGRDPRWAPPA